MNYRDQNRALTVWGLIFSLLLSFSVYAKSPAAGTLIQNQASATYKDANGTVQMATSNVVATLIQQVGAMELVQDQTRLGAVGNTVYLPHVLTNTGNGVDTYSLSATNVTTGDQYDFDLAKVLFYADKDKDGVPDSTVSISSTGALSADESFYFVVAAEIPSAATDTQQGKLTIKGLSTFVEIPTDMVVEKTNTDTVIVSSSAIINVVKSISANSGASPSGAYTITLSYENTGVVAATNVILVDTLPAGMRYFSDSTNNHALWSKGAITLTDNGEEDQSGIAYCAYDASCANTPFSNDKVTAVIASVLSGEKGSVSFDVTIDGGLPASVLENIAQFEYHNGVAQIAVANTNQVPFEIVQKPAVIANGSVNDNDPDNADNQGGTSDSFIVDVATRGATVPFENIIRNKGNSDDVFDISINAGDTFPVGTVFQLFQSDGFTPLMDSNNNGTVDTGVLAAGARYKVILKAVLGIGASGNNSNAGFKVTKTATSSLDSTVFDSVVDHLKSITADSVDLTNDSAGAQGGGAGPEVTAVTSLELLSGGTVVFKLFVNNTSDTSGSYELQYSSTNFNANILEAGWKVEFHHDGGNSDCSTLGVVSSATKSIASGANQLMCAVVAAPANAIADGTQHSIYFKVFSPLTGVADIKHDAVNVIAKAALGIEPDQIGQTEPGGSVIYPHIVNNYGNTDLECISISAVDLDPQSAWSSVIYKDVNADGKLDAGDTPLSNQTLAVGESFAILIKLFAPATVAMGSENKQALIVSGYKDNGDADASTCMGTALNAEVQDVTTVNTSKMSIVKEQAVDADCVGGADGAFSTTSFQVQPGACVIYRLTATNTGAHAVNNARIDDAAPTFTQFTGTANVNVGNIAGGVIGTDGVITGGSISGANITLKSGEALVLTFGVRLD
ncbi:MAG: DUF11 domain-containing protein [Cocleimonas sp.]|nr:DUF11 domain-containing protein [Cocleimonas sp.]